MRILLTLLPLLLAPVILFTQEASVGLDVMYPEDQTTNPVTFAERIQVSYGISAGITRQLLDVYRSKGFTPSAQESVVESLLFEYKRLSPKGLVLTKEELSALEVEPGSEIADILNYDCFLSQLGNARPVLPVSDEKNRLWFGIAPDAFRALWRNLENREVPIERFQQQFIVQIDQFVLFRQLLAKADHQSSVNDLAIDLLDAGNFEQVGQLMVNQATPEKTKDARAFFLAGLAQELNLEGEKAASYYEKAVKLDRRNSLYASVYGKNLLRAGQFDQAIGQFHAALKLTSSPKANKDDIGLHLNHLGEAYLRKGQPDRAIPLFEKAIKSNQRILGPDHRQLVTNYNNVSLAFKAKGDYQMALKYLEKGLAINLATVGLNHPNTAVNYNNLGLVYLAQQDFDRALQNFRQALNIVSTVYGPNHHFAASGFNHLGTLFLKQGNLQLAADHFNQAETILAEIHGNLHVRLANVYHHLGVVNQKMERLDTALEYFGRALEINRLAYGDQHRSVAYGYNNMADIYLTKGDCDAAIRYFQAGLKVFEGRFGEEHPSVFDSYSRLGKAYAAKKDWSLALKFFQKSMTIAQAIYGHQHPKMAPVHNHLGEAYLQRNEFDKAFENLTQALQINLTYKGDNHPDIAMIYSNIGNIFLRKKEADVAIEYLERALEINQSRSKANPGLLAVRYNDLGAAHHSKGAFTTATEFYHKALEIAIGHFGQDHAQVSMIYHNLGEAHLSHQPAKALKYFTMALEVDRNLCSAAFEVPASRYWDIGRAYQVLGDHAEAISHYEKALSLDSRIQSRNEYGDLGVAYMQAQQTERAGRFCKEYTQRFPDHPLAYRNWMLYYTVTGKLGKAMKNLEKAVYAGFSDVSWIRSEEMLKPLHEKRKYHQMLQMMEAAARP